MVFRSSQNLDRREVIGVKILNKAIRINGKDKYVFTILRQCRSKGDLHYAEIEEQVFRNVLKATLKDGDYEYYNKSIAAIRFRPPEFHSEETKSILKQRIKDNGHPLEHPNKGKKLPQCAPKECRSKDRSKISVRVNQERCLNV